MKTASWIKILCAYYYDMSKVSIDRIRVFELVLHHADQISSPSYGYLEITLHYLHLSVHTSYLK